MGGEQLLGKGGHCFYMGGARTHQPAVGQRNPFVSDERFEKRCRLPPILKVTKGTARAYLERLTAEGAD